MAYLCRRFVEPLFLDSNHWLPRTIGENLDIIGGFKRKGVYDVQEVAEQRLNAFCHQRYNPEHADAPRHTYPSTERFSTKIGLSHTGHVHVGFFSFICKNKLASKH